MKTPLVGYTSHPDDMPTFIDMVAETHLPFFWPVVHAEVYICDDQITVDICSDNKHAPVEPDRIGEKQYWFRER